MDLLANIEFIRGIAVAAIIASITVGLSDLLLLGSGKPAADYWNRPFDVIAGMPSWRIAAGGALGSIALPFVAIGFIIVFAALSPAGVALALPPAFLLALFMLYGVAVHAEFSFLGDVQKEKAQFDDAHAAQPALDRVFERQSTHFKLMTLPTLIVLAVGSIWFSTLILFGETLYPRWFALYCPIVVIALVRRSGSYLPIVISGWIRPACVHVMATPLLIYSAMLTWNGVAS